ncbi:hypothetical protein C0995_016567 [Termitomyces sp. Mi166|nr:hypothetical protein C0995_016567 [Termitomyces sp. Mi166\
MLTIRWNELSSLAQHWGFASRVDDIFQFHGQMSSIGASPRKTFDFKTARESHLIARLDSRTSGLYPRGRKTPLSYSDALYPSSSNLNLHRRENSQETHLLIANISALSHHIPAHLDTVSNLWQRLRGVQILTNDSHGINSYSQLISPTLTKLFLTLYKVCRKASSSKMAFLLSTIVYTSSRNAHDDQIKDLVPTFLAFSRFPEFQAIDPPSSTSFNFEHGFDLDRKVLSNLLTKYPLDPPINRPRRETYESDDHYYDRRKDYLESMRYEQLQDITNRLVRQWPCKAPTMPCLSKEFDLFDLRSSDLEDELSGYFLAWFNNMKFKEFVHRVQWVLDEVRVCLSDPIPASKLVAYQIPSMPLERTRPKPRRLLGTTLDELVSCREPHVLPTSRPALSPGVDAEPITMPTVQVPKEVVELDSLVKQFKQGPQVLHRKYGKALESSLTSYLHSLKLNTSVSDVITSCLSLEKEYELQRHEFNDIYRLLKESLTPKTRLEAAMDQAGHWPSLTTRSLLELLSKDKIGITTSFWEAAVITLAQRLVKFQHSRRALLLEISRRGEELLKELGNVGYEKDSAFLNPEWLLIQVTNSQCCFFSLTLKFMFLKIDSNFTVRSVQNHVAKEMHSPCSERNTLTQLNMGEGKSAVIVPLISSALADGKRLVRVVVLKPLVNQMFDLLVHRLSGLTNRRIFYLPFSRDFKPVPEFLEKLQSLYETCVRERGILLIQPEHILSFRLMGIDLAAGAYTRAAECLLRSYRWLSSNSRDVLDESDEILRATYQLVYTSGLQEPMENHPDRWTIIQEVIGYALKHVNTIRRRYPDGLEVHTTKDRGSPIIRILDSKAGDALIDLVVSEVLSNDKFKLIPPHIHLAASEFVRGNYISEAAALETLRTVVRESSSWKRLLLYRGLLGHGLLHFVLREKRWRVDYGLDLARTLLAVPYRAKDLPSLRADFGHPDVALLLTCLSYYYGGLTEEQLDQSFELLCKLDDPPLEYAEWVSDREEIPSSLRDIKGVNLDDEHQRKTILGPLFRKNKAVVDFFLSNVVFPRYAKQFPKKLSTSSWDLAETKNQVTTGFSGTNDNRYLLLTSIQQNNTTAMGDYDPFGQLATNAKVLSILLRPENDTYSVTLGPKLTKDRLVQGCMRMRQLGRGQSVIFFAPSEVDRSIRACELSPLDSSAKIGSKDILRWVMWQTCEHIRHYLPHWAQQGIEYKRRNDAWVSHEKDPYASDALQTLRTAWEGRDARTLEEMYEEQPNNQAAGLHAAFQHSDLKERLDDLGVSQLGDPKTDEEQERQVAHEAERERQRELPPKVQPASPTLHKALESLIRSGVFNPDHTSPFIPLFSPMVTTHEWSEALFSTKDFATTIEGGVSVGDFLRPVNWILSVPKHHVLVVLSPFEVNKLLPMIWKSEYVHLHIYAPRVNRNMRTMEDLRFFSIPPLPASLDPLAFIPNPMLKLNLWAGQLYLKDFETYKQLCRVLGLVGAESGPRMWDSDGFVKREDRTGAMKEQCRMVVSPVVFLKELFSLRRKGMAYSPTHMGKILNVRPLEEKDFDD